MDDYEDKDDTNEALLSVNCQVLVIIITLNISYNCRILDIPLTKTCYQFKDENIVSVELKEEPDGTFESNYMEDICLGTFDKVFQPIDHADVVFSDDMVNKFYDPNLGDLYISNIF